MATTWRGLDTTMCSRDKAPHTYEGVENMSTIIEAQCLSLQRGTSRQQYIPFQPVTLSQFAEIDQARKQIGRAVRIRYYPDRNLFIVKLMPLPFHETSHSRFAILVDRKCVAMGLNRELVTTQATKYTGRDGSSHEGDSAFKPLSFRIGGASWPTLMIEAGWSESLDELRTDAKWWLQESGGEIKIVILISVLSGGRKYHVEEWELNRQRTPRSFQEINIDLDLREVRGCPLILEFEKIFLRPCERNESNIVLNEEDLLDWAEDLWKSAM